MTRPLRLQFQNAFYHIISRGDKKNIIFPDDDSKKKFISVMNQAFIKFQVICYAYCIMNNHYHIYLSTPFGNISKVIHYINTSYSNWFSKHCGFPGHVFQGRFKSILIDSENYSLVLINYIHLNPLKAGIVNDLKKYEFSSLNCYLGICGSKIENLKKSFILLNFDKNLYKAQEKYYKFLIRNLNLKIEKNNKYKKILIGDTEYKHQIEKNLKEYTNDYELKCLKMNKTRYYKKILMIIKKNMKIEEFDILYENHNNIFRKIFMYLLKTHTRMTLKEIGDIFAMNYKAVSMYVSRFERDMDKTFVVKTIVKKMSNQIQKLDLIN